MRHFLPSPVNNTGSSPSVDVDRCFNCWKPTHTTRCCPLPAISVREREALRIRLNIPYPLRNGRKYYEMLYSSLGCTNCWSSIEHRWDTCPKPRISIVDSEKLRYKMGMPLHGEWKRILEENGVSSTIVGDVVLVVREDDDDDSDNPGPVVQKISPAVAVALGGGVRKVSSNNSNNNNNNNNNNSNNSNNKTNNIQGSSGSRIPPAHATYCWNCWTTGHIGKPCPEPTITFPKAENLRRSLGIPKPNHPTYDELLAYHHCRNCWDTGHKAQNCPKGIMTMSQREMTRVAKGVPLIDVWRNLLIQAGVRSLSISREAKEKWDREMDVGVGITRSFGRKEIKARSENEGGRKIDPRWDKDNLWTWEHDKTWQQLATGAEGDGVAAAAPPLISQDPPLASNLARDGQVHAQGGGSGFAAPDLLNLGDLPVTSHPSLLQPPLSKSAVTPAMKGVDGTITTAAGNQNNNSSSSSSSSNNNNNNNNNNNTTTATTTTTPGGGGSNSGHQKNNKLRVALAGAINDLRGLSLVLDKVYNEVYDWD